MKDLIYIGLMLMCLTSMVGLAGLCARLLPRETGGKP